MHESPMTVLLPPNNNLYSGENSAPEGTSGETQRKTNERNRKIEENFRTWLARLPTVSTPANNPQNCNSEPNGGSSESTDLYSFYRELCALRHEFRKNFHRSHDSTTHFSDTLENFTGLLHQINQRLEQQKNDRNQFDLQSKRHFFLPLVDIYERFLRLHEHLQQPPPEKKFWQRRQHFEGFTSERKKIAKGFEILEKHFQTLLEKEGVQRQICRGEQFDPTTMTAVEVVNQPEIPNNEVVEELTSGYSYHNQTLKLAEVIVNRGNI